jgi:hypothetical protein
MFSGLDAIQTVRNILKVKHLGSWRQIGGRRMRLLVYLLHGRWHLRHNYGLNTFMTHAN